MIVEERLRDSAIFEYVEQCANALLDFVPVSNAAFYILDEGYRPSFCQALRSTPAFQADAYIHRLWRSDPLLPMPDAVPVDPVRTLTTTLAECRQGQHTDYLAFIRREGCIDTLKVDFFFRDKIVGGVAMGRQADAGPFGDGDVSLLRKCSNLMHLAGAYGEGRDRNTASIRAFRFTPRESEIVDLLRQGATNRDIAARFDIGIATVKSHLINMFEKAGVHSRTALLAAVFH